MNDSDIKQTAKFFAAAMEKGTWTRPQLVAILQAFYHAVHGDNINCVSDATELIGSAL